MFNQKWWDAEWIPQATTEDSKVMGMIMPSVFEGMLNFLMISMKADLYSGTKTKHGKVLG